MGQNWAKEPQRVSATSQNRAVEIHTIWGANEFVHGGDACWWWSDIWLRYNKVSFFFESQEHRTKISGDSQKPQLVQKFDFFSSPTVSPSLGFNRQPKQMVVEDVSLLGEVWLDRNRWFMITLSENFAQKCSKKCLAKYLACHDVKKTVARLKSMTGWWFHFF